MPYTRYQVLRRPTTGAPIWLRFRNGSVALEIVRDCSAIVPTWVLRARKPEPHKPRPTGCRAAVAPGDQGCDYRTDSLTGCRLPTVAPIQRTAFPASGSGVLVIVTSLFGRSHLEHMLRDGVVLEAGSPGARVMDALVRLGHARADHQLPAQ